MGLVQRWQASVKASKLFIGRGGMNLQLQAASSASVMGNQGGNTLASSSGAVVFPLADPVYGAVKTLALTTVSSGIFVKGANGATFDGTNPVFKSTVACVVELLGLSTARWMVKSAFPGSTLTNSILTFSATT